MFVYAALGWHGSRDAASYLDEIPRDADPDQYGEGGVVAELETEIAKLLGKPAAAFMPGGTMAQQIALRIHADRRGRRTVVFHPYCHLDSHEERGFERLHDLHGVPVGDREQLLTLDALQSVAEPPAALLSSFPARPRRTASAMGGPRRAGRVGARPRGGGAHGRGAAVGLRGLLRQVDGGDLRAVRHGVRVVLQAARRPARALPRRPGGRRGRGRGVAAPARRDPLRHVAERRLRLERAAAAVPPHPRYRRHALAVADALRDLDGVDIVPDPPQTTMMHLVFARPA